MKCWKYVLLGAGLFGADQILKQMVERDDPERYPRKARHTGNLLKLYRNHNDGFPFGFLRNYPQIVKMIPLVMTSAAAGVLARVMSEKHATAADRTAWTLITAGGLSNLLDRLRKGYVVDYLSIDRKIVNKVVFNLGDVGVLLGNILTTVSVFVRDHREAADSASADQGELR